MVYFKELLPNPAGKDTAGEFITLFNDGGGAINLRGWSIKDASGKKFTLGAETLLPDQELKLPYSLTRINLNNDGDAVTLYDARGAEVDGLSYSQVGEEEIVSSSKITPPREADQLANESPLAAQAFTGTTISAETISPLLIALGLAVTFSIGTAILTRKLIGPE